MLGIGMGLARPSPSGSRGPSYDPAAKALFARMAVQPDATRKGRYDTLIKALKAAGIWSKLDCLYVMAAHDAQAARLNIVRDGYNLTAVNSPAFAANRGYEGDGAGAYLMTGFNPHLTPSAFTASACHMGAWNLTTVNYAAASAAFGGTASSNATRMYARNSSGLDCQFNNGLRLYPAIADSFGYSVGSVTPDGLVGAFRNGGLVGSASGGNGVVPNEPFVVLRSAGSNYSRLQLATWHIGGGLTSQQVADLHTIQRNYLQSVGAVS